jgi:hypothetical protein
MALVRERSPASRMVSGSGPLAKAPWLEGQIENIIADQDPPQQLQSPENIALVPKYEHWQITNYYQMPQEETGWIPPREYLRGKSFEERYQFGLRVLRKFKVLK